MRTRSNIRKHVLPLLLILAFILTMPPHTVGQAYSAEIDSAEERPSSPPDFSDDQPLLSTLEEESDAPPPQDDNPPPQDDDPPQNDEPADYLVVYTYETLRAALEEANTYTTIYLGDDITATENDIAIHSSKTAVIIDGHPPGAPDGEIYTFTQYSNNETDATIYLSSSNHTTKSITVRNLNIIGADLQSLVSVPENLAHITVSYENLTYEGPQAVKNPSGSVWLMDSTFTITAATGSLAEAGLVKMKGSLQVNSSELVSLFWLTGESPELFVQENASVIVDTDGFFLHDDTQSPDIKIADNAFFRIDCSSGFTHLGKNIRNMRIGSDSTVFITQSAPQTQASLRVEQLFELSPNSMLNIIRIGAPGIALYFPHPQGRAVFNNPKRVILFSRGLPSIAFADEGVLEITTESINVWQDFSGMIEAPTHIWNNTHGDVFMLLGQYADAELQSLTHNLSSDAPITDPLTAQSFNYSPTALLTFGQFPLVVEPLYTNSSTISGTTDSGAQINISYTASDGSPKTASGTADADGSFEIPIPADTLDTQHTIMLDTTMASLTLRKEVQVYDPALLEFSLKVPKTISFTGSTLPTVSTRYPRDIRLFSFSVTDTRSLRNYWRIDASLTAPLTATVDSESHTLPNALVFVDKNGTETPLSTAPLTLHHQSKPPAGTSEITWNTDEGILLRINPGTVYSGATYTTTIQWTLVDAP